MRRITPTAVVLFLIALIASAKTVDMEGRKASLVGRTTYKVKKLGKDKTVLDFDIDFDTRTWTGTMEEGTIEVSGTFQFLGKGGRKIDISYDAPSLAKVEAHFGAKAAELLKDKEGVDHAITADVDYYKLTFKLSKNKKKARFKGKFRVDYTDDDNGDTYDGQVKMPMKGAVERGDQ
jgi:hypothetical protein